MNTLYYTGNNVSSISLHCNYPLPLKSFMVKENSYPLKTICLKASITEVFSFNPL